jgi:hypothetical protein
MHSWSTPSIGRSRGNAEDRTVDDAIFHDQRIFFQVNHKQTNGNGKAAVLIYQQPQSIIESSCKFFSNARQTLSFSAYELLLHCQVFMVKTSGNASYVPFLV